MFMAKFTIREATLDDLPMLVELQAALTTAIR